MGECTVQHRNKKVIDIKAYSECDKSVWTFHRKPLDGEVVSTWRGRAASTFSCLCFVNQNSLSQLTQIDSDQFAHAKGRFFDFSDTEHASICMYTLPTYCTSGAKEKTFQVSSTLSMANDATLMLKSNIANNK